VNSLESGLLYECFHHGQKFYIYFRLETVILISLLSLLSEQK